ncbi:MAG: glycosyltransferase [Candidatus Moraniibacteriota bacterium]
MKYKKILIGIPCYNEEKTIQKVVEDFKKELPEAKILVVDNNSKDRTAEEARKAGAAVVKEKKQGKGFAVQKILQNFKEDFLVLVDGDDTYIAKDIHKLLEIAKNEEADMVVGNRILKENQKAFSTAHWWGNKILTLTLNLLFGTKIKDMESGYRVFNKNFTDSCILITEGFGIEPEFTIQAIENKFTIKEAPVSLQLRTAGVSKLNTLRDGSIVLYTIFSLFRDYKPLQFFGFFSIISFILGSILAWRGIYDFLETGIVIHLPSLVTGSFLILFSFISVIAGLILSSLKRRHDELAHLIRKK